MKNPSTARELKLDGNYSYRKVSTSNFINFTQKWKKNLFFFPHNRIKWKKGRKYRFSLQVPQSCNLEAVNFEISNFFESSAVFPLSLFYKITRRKEGENIGREEDHCLSEGRGSWDIRPNGCKFIYIYLEFVCMLSFFSYLYIEMVPQQH